uniref:Ring finger domain-containing protein n=1 Tax=Colletotrichum fructicola (strain Nara gc5) TaxID=1213859 RepID=L2FT97_COLFN
MLDIPDVAVDVEVEEAEMEDGDGMAHLEIIVEEMEDAAAEEERANARPLQTSLRDVTNALASTLLLPMISAGVGELLRLALPKHLTAPPNGFGRFRVRTGLLQDQWGRNLVGGCMYIVLRDAFRLYTKYRMAQNKPLRKVRNVDRRRGNASS